MKKIILILFLFSILALSSCSMKACADDPACKRVLFIGNSYTYMNNLPNMLARLAKSGGKHLDIEMRAPGGWTLSDHLNSTETIQQIQASKWNYVVLQEQSMVPASKAAVNTQMYPALVKLTDIIKATGAKPILFATWGHRDGWPENGLSDYEPMQMALNESFLNLSQQMQLPLAPVGFAWLSYWRQNPKLDLWQADGSHPNEYGTYLAACVFYAVLFNESPEDLTYYGNLTAEEAKSLQDTASHIVINNASRWNLP